MAAYARALVCLSLPLALGASGHDGSKLQGGAAGYFSIRPDLRRCAAPRCGGFWAASLNEATTRCPGEGKPQAECYIAEVDTTQLGPQASGGTFQIVRGLFSLRNFGQAGRFAVLKASEGWTAATPDNPSGGFVKLADNGIRCITTPCFSIQQTYLNTGSASTISDLDTSALSLTADQTAELQQGLVDGGVLAAGASRSPSDASGKAAVTWIASQVYFRYVAPVLSSKCKTDAECTKSPYNKEVTSARDCYCPICGEPMLAAQAAVAEASWQRYCSTYGPCPMALCVLTPPVGCVASTCSYVPQPARLLM